MGLLSIVDFANRKEDTSPLPPVSHEEYREGITTIKAIIHDWIVRELNMARTQNLPTKYTLPYIFRDININSAVLPEMYQSIDRALTDSDESRTGGRWLEVVARININVAPEVLATIRERFIASYAYEIGADYAAGTAEDWEDVLTTFPWMCLLVFVQELWDSEQLHYSHISS